MECIQHFIIVAIATAKFVQVWDTNDEDAVGLCNELILASATEVSLYRP